MNTWHLKFVGGNHLSVAAGQPVYRLGGGQCSASGLTWSQVELDTAMSGPVESVLFDDAGRADIETILADLAETEFELERLKGVLAIPDEIEDWRVGEAIAESYLTHQRSCFFPWPDGRDERKTGSSLPGADLVGFSIDENGDCLAFGEVKTSSEDRYPPRSMYGRTGLKQQMEDLRDNESIRDSLLRYLGYRVNTASWRTRFEAASKRYLRDKSDIQLYGVLIRDVRPDSQDLSARSQSLCLDRPTETRIELLALYLPEGCIDGIGRSSLAQRNRGQP